MAADEVNSLVMNHFAYDEAVACTTSFYYAGAWQQRGKNLMNVKDLLNTIVLSAPVTGGCSDIKLCYTKNGFLMIIALYLLLEIS
ncbi:hypothetical protein CUMW_111990 [Citrus unshiu]|nr:hypothetical protein CUMW_111990 [Citrus unshiu]